MLQAIRNLLQPKNPARALKAAQIAITTTDCHQKKDTFSKTPEANLRIAKLIMVSAQNNNKYYEMREQRDGTFTALYGRVGSRSMTATYPMAQWDKKFREKTRKGYQDQTHLFATKSSVAEFARIDNPLIRDLMDDLLRFARQSIFTNYNVSSEEVTQTQVEQAQSKLN